MNVVVFAAPLLVPRGVTGLRCTVRANCKSKLDRFVGLDMGPFRDVGPCDGDLFGWSSLAPSMLAAQRE